MKYTRRELFGFVVHIAAWVVFAVLFFIWALRDMGQL